MVPSKEPAELRHTEERAEKRGPGAVWGGRNGESSDEREKPRNGVAAPRGGLQKQRRGCGEKREGAVKSLITSLQSEG